MICAQIWNILCLCSYWTVREAQDKSTHGCICLDKYLWHELALYCDIRNKAANTRIAFVGDECETETYVREVPVLLNTLRPRQNGRHFADDIFKCIFLNENVWIPIQISLKFVPKSPINNIPALVQMMVWRRPGAKPLSEPMMVS